MSQTTVKTARLIGIMIIKKVVQSVKNSSCLKIFKIRLRINRTEKNKKITSA